MDMVRMRERPTGWKCTQAENWTRSVAGFMDWVCWWRRGIWRGYHRICHEENDGDVTLYVSLNRSDNGPHDVTTTLCLFAFSFESGLCKKRW